MRTLSLLLLLSLALPAGAEDAWRADAGSAASWALQPGWQANPSPAAAVRAQQGALLFSVPEANKAMKFSRSVRPFPLSYYRYLVVRYRAENLQTNSDNYLVYVNDGTPDGCYAIRLQDAKSDGAWRTAAVDLSRLAKGSAITSVAVQVAPAGVGGARLWIESLAFSDEVPAGAELLRQEAPPATSGKPDRSLPLSPEWTAQRTWLGNPGTDPQVAQEKGGVTFRVSGANHGMKWSWPLPQAVALGDYRYLAVRYKAGGITAFGDYALCVIGTARGSGMDYTPVAGGGALEGDGRWHTLCVELAPAAAKIPTARELALQIQAGGEGRAWLTLGDLRFTNQPARPRLGDYLTYTAGWPANSGRFVPLSLSSLLGEPAARLRDQLGLSEWFSGDKITAEGIPFRLRTAGGEVCRTGMLARGKLAVPVGRKVSEVYLLLASLFAGEEEPARGGGPLLALRDVDRFRVRLEYADGRAAECLPLDAGAGVRRVAAGPRVLCAFADPRRPLARVVIEDRTGQAAFGLVAATACTAPRGPLDAHRLRLQPAVDCRLQGPRNYALRRPPAPGVRIAGSHIRLQNAQLDATLDTSDGLKLLGLAGPAAGPALPAGGGPLLAATLDGKPVPLTVTDVSGPSAAEARLTLAGREAAAGLRVRLRLSLGAGPELVLEGEAENAGAAPLAVGLRTRVPGVRVGTNAADDYYLFPQSGAVWSNAPANLEAPYCGLFPVQFLDVTNRRTGGGVWLRTEDREGLPRSYTLARGGDGLTTLGVSYPERALAPGERRPLVRTLIGIHPGDWHAAMDAYRAWLRTWYKPPAPRKRWFREVFNFRQRFLWSYDPLYDARAGRFELEKALTEGAAQFGGIDYLHLFDWGNCGKYGRIYGRTGDYSPADTWAGGWDAFRKAIAGVQAKGVPVGLYIEGYLLEEKGKLGQAGKAWQRVGADGKPQYWPQSSEMFICPWAPAWREIQADTYARTVRETGASGMYLDEFGFTAPWAACYSASHGHPVPSSPVIGERGLTQMVRTRIDAARPGVALYSEECPPDVNSLYQDGSFTYSMSRALSAPSPVPLNLLRFAIPSFKTFEILTCDHPTGSWATGVCWTFFNGEGIWLEGPASYWFEPETLAAIRKCHALLRAHKDAFAGDDVEALAPTLVEGVFANAFRAPSESVYTLYNSHPETVTAEVLRLPHRAGRRYEDAWNGRPLRPRTAGGFDYLSVTLGPQGVGCVVVR